MLHVSACTWGLHKSTWYDTRKQKNVLASRLHGAALFALFVFFSECLDGDVVSGAARHCSA